MIDYYHQVPDPLLVFGDISIGIVVGEIVERDLVLELDLGHFDVDGTGSRDAQRSRMFQRQESVLR